MIYSFKNTPVKMRMVLPGTARIMAAEIMLGKISDKSY